MSLAAPAQSDNYCLAGGGYVIKSYTSRGNMKGKYQLSLLKQMPGNKCAWAQNTQNKLVNHRDEHDRGISWYKLRSVPLPANVTSSYTRSHQLWISSVRLTGSTKDTWADSKRENKGTPKSGIYETSLSSLAVRPTWRKMYTTIK